MKFNPIVLSALAVAASSPSISAAPFPAGSGQATGADTMTTPQPNESLSPRAADIGSFARRASLRGGQRRSSGKHAKEKQQIQEDKVKRADLLGSLGGGAPPSGEMAGYQGQVQTGLTGLGLGQLGGPVNGVLGTASGLESSVQGTLNGLGLGAVNGVAKSVLGTVNGLEDSVQGTVKGLGLPEPLGSTVGNVITTAKGIQGQALSQLNVVGPNSGNGDASNQSPLDIQNQLDGLGLSSLTGLAGGALAPVNGVQSQLEGQLSGLGLGALSDAVPNAGSTLPTLDPSILSNILSTPNGIAALNSLSPAQLSSLGLGSATNVVSSPLSAVDGVQTQLQGLGLGGATGAVTGLAGNSPLSGLTNGPLNSLTSAPPVAQGALAALSDPQALQQLPLSQAKQIAQLEKLVLTQNQRLSTSAERAGAPVGWPNPPVDQIKSAASNNAFGDTAQVFGGGLYNNKLALPQPTAEGASSESKFNASDKQTSGAEAIPVATPVSKAEGDNPEANDNAQSTTGDPATVTNPSSWGIPTDQTTAISVDPTASAAMITPAPTVDAQVKVFAKLNPSKTEGWYQTTSGWPWPMDAEHLPPPIPAFTSWGVKMAEANASARQSDIDKVSGAADMSAIPPPATAYAAWGVKTAEYRENGVRDSRNTEVEAPEATSTTSASEPRDEDNSRMEKRSKSDESGDGAENQSAPGSPGSFHSATTSPGTPVPNNADKSVPSVSGGAEGPQLVLGDSKAPLGTANKRSHGVPHVQEPQDPDERLEDDPVVASVAKRQHHDVAVGSQTRSMKKRQDDEEEHEDDPAEDNSENMPAQPEPTPETEPEEDPVTISPAPDLPVPLPKTPSAQPALHSKAHRVHKKDENRKPVDNGDHYHRSMAFASPGGRPAMRRQQAYSPEHKHDGDKNEHIHVHWKGHSREHHHKRDEGHGDEAPDLPATAPVDTMSASQGKDPKQSAEYANEHAQMSPDCWEAMAAGKHMEHAQKRPAKLQRRNALPDLANAASGNVGTPPRVSAHPPSYQAAIGNVDTPDPEEDDGDGSASTSKDGKAGKTPGDKKKKKKEKEPKKEREPLSKNGDQEKDNRKKEGKQSVADMQESAAEEEDDEMRRAKFFKRRIVRKLSMKRWL